MLMKCAGTSFTFFHLKETQQFRSPSLNECECVCVYFVIWLLVIKDPVSDLSNKLKCLGYGEH